jgi:hypothetical protein
MSGSAPFLASTTVMPAKDGESTTHGDFHFAGFGCSVLLSSNVSDPVHVYEMIGSVSFGCHYSMRSIAVVASWVEKEHYCAGDGE